jgi:hypothetical protein
LGDGGFLATIFSGIIYALSLTGGLLYGDFCGILAPDFMRFSLLNNNYIFMQII